jgi:hypothetical protein
MKDRITVLYLTDNKLDSVVDKVCQYYLLDATNGKKLITVSQQPMSLGDNVCVGEIGRNGLSIDLQIKAGLAKVDTEFVAIAEHDCLYTREHFNWIPPDSEYFYYNKNNWLLQYSNVAHPEYDGMFSFKRRKVQSQLVVSADKLREATDQKIEILSDPSVQHVWEERTRLGEPGTNDLSRSLRVFNNVKTFNKWVQLRYYIIRHQAKYFKTELPNIDIRHGGNLTGQRRGGHRRWKLPYWGTMSDILNIEDSK